MQVVLATGNPGKVAELAAMLADSGITVLPQSQFNCPDADETGTTFEENAIIKARQAAKLTGLPAIADDSGLEVDALAGRPGIYSARYAGKEANDQANIDKLLQEMDGQTNRQARFHCVLVYMRHAADPTPLICHGIWQGEIAMQQHGQQGFGYDPVFWLAKLNKTAAELAKAEKAAISHRGQALRQLVSYLGK